MKKYRFLKQEVFIILRICTMIEYVPFYDAKKPENYRSTCRVFNKRLMPKRFAAECALMLTSEQARTVIELIKCARAECRTKGEFHCHIAVWPEETDAILAKFLE